MLPTYPDYFGTKTIWRAGAGDIVHVLFQVHVKEFENEVQLRFLVDDVKESASIRAMRQPSIFFASL